MDIVMLKACFRGAPLLRSLKVAAVVGTALTAINQGDIILAGNGPVLWKTALTYLVPFFVATYGAYGAIASQSQKSS